MELFWHLTVCKQKTILILNWIVWNRTVYKNEFGINNLQWLMYHQTKLKSIKKSYFKNLFKKKNYCYILMFHVSCRFLNRILHLCLRINKGTTEINHMNWELEENVWVLKIYNDKRLAVTMQFQTGQAVSPQKLPCEMALGACGPMFRNGSDQKEVLNEALIRKKY